MNFEEFKERLMEEVSENLYERGNEVGLNTTVVEKMNETYNSMVVTLEGSNVGMNINLDAYFSMYEEGMHFDDIVERVVSVVEKHLPEMPTVNVEELLDYENMKNKLTMEVVGFERNQELLSKVPHEKMEDLAVVYRFELNSNNDERATILVSNDLMERMGITHEQLREDAMNNAPVMRPAVIKGMNEVMLEMMGPEVEDLLGDMGLPQEELMYVATVPSKTAGAGVIAYQEFMDQAAERLGGDFFILPSSIHEILLVKDDGAKTYQELQVMVEEVNATQVAPEEKLSDNVYHYDSENHIFELAEKFEARKKEKEMGIKEKPRERESVLGELTKKKEEIAKNPVKKEVERVAKLKGGEVL